MKQLCIVLIGIVLLFSAGCKPQGWSYHGPDDKNEPVILHVECRDDVSVKQTVIQLLKQARVADWTIRQEGGMLEIESRYRSLAADHAAYLQRQLEETPGVVHVEIKRDGMPVKNPNL